MAIYAVIVNSVVVNTIVWDGTTAWEQPTGSELIIIPDGVVAEIGYAYDVATSTFTPTT
jgi:NADPH-dependent 2,4-dienoyl-CoA reductase/sulfur reductase-like enzyme